MYMTGYFNGRESELSPEKRHSEQKPSEHFTVEDLLDFSNEDDVMTDAFFESVTTGNSTDSSTITVVDSCNSSVSGNETNFSGNFGSKNFSDTQLSGGDLCVPYDDLAELEWLSNFVEEDSFSTDDQYRLHNLHLISGSSKPPTPDSSSHSQIQNPTRSIVPISQSVPAKAQRSKRSRAAPCDWSSRLLHLLSPFPSSSPATSANSDTSKSKTAAAAALKKRESGNESGEGRRCLHCASEKTPQWRTGPMGPKTLCNACGVRYKSGRLVPEYRPAASPTFVSTKHSNSHRKVLELRRQRDEMHGSAHQNQAFMGQNSMYGVSDGGDYLIHHRTGLDYRHMM